MRILLCVVPALLAAGPAAAQNASRPNPLDAAAKAPPLEFRSAFEGYRPYAEPQAFDWRGANDAVRDAGGHAGQQSSKPQPASPEASGGAAEKPGAGTHQGHGAHK